MENTIYELIIYFRDSVIATFVNTASRYAMPWLGTSILIGFCSFYYYEIKSGKRKWDDYLTFLVPKKIYLHPSAVMDYKLNIINLILGQGYKIIGFLSLGLGSQLTYDFLKKIYFPTWSRWETNGLTIFFAGFFGLLVYDFTNFLIHYLGHINKPIWRIHSLHHSAEVMTPFTDKRNHPLWVIFQGASKNIVTAIFSGFFGYITFNGLDMKFFLEVSMAIVVFNAIAVNLRHSHVWISYGKFLSHIFVSPAMHQIHHSLDMKHRNKNMGVIFSFWDLMFGTLYIPIEKEDLQFGISKENPNPHKTLKNAFLLKG